MPTARRSHTSSRPAVRLCVLRFLLYLALYLTHFQTYQTHNPFENIFVRLNSLEGPVQDPISNPSETVLKLSAVVPY